MRRASPTRQRLVALGLLAIVLFTYPILGLPTGALSGVPVIYLYLFGVWAGLIALASWVVGQGGK